MHCAHKGDRGNGRWRRCARSGAALLVLPLAVMGLSPATAIAAPVSTTTTTLKVRVKTPPKTAYTLSGSGWITWTIDMHIPCSPADVKSTITLSVPSTQVDTSDHAIRVTVQGHQVGHSEVMCHGFPMGGTGLEGGPLPMTLTIGPPTSFTWRAPGPGLVGQFEFKAPGGFVRQSYAVCSPPTTTTAPSWPTTTRRPPCKVHRGPEYVATAPLTAHPCLAMSLVSCTASGALRLVMRKD